MATNINAAKRYKDIKLPFICPLTNRLFNSTKGLAIYLSKTLKISHKEYYDKYIHHRNSSCFFCNEEGLFMSVGKGYRNLCTKKDCLEKSFHSHSIEGIMYREMISREEAMLRFEIENKRQLSGRMKTFEKLREKDKDWDKKRSRNNKLFWMNKGFTEDESQIKATDVMKELNSQSLACRRANPENYKDIYNTKIEFYLKRGFSEEESLHLLSKRQTTFSLEKCIEKHGESIGRKIWLDRQERWQKSLSNNGNIKGGYSKISQILFNELIKIYEEKEKENIYYWSKNKEYSIRTHKSLLLYDFTDIKNKKIIEYNGDQYHGNPKVYNEDDLPHPYNKSKGFTAKHLWEKDEIKVNIAIDNGFEVLTIWDSDYRKFPKETLEKCIEFINE